MSTVGLTWNKAIRTHGLKLTTEERAAGWPDAFSVENLARLQYPSDGTDTDKKRAARNQSALIEAMRSAIAGGALSVKRFELKDVVALRPALRGNVPAHRVRMLSHSVKVAEYTVHFIDRGAFRDWLASQGEEPSEHIRAWLRPLDQAETHQEEAAPAVAATRKETQADRVEACLKECERRASEQGKPFDCSNMPGQKAQFFDLLRRFDASFKGLKDPTLYDYVKQARCTWAVGANANPDATQFYRELFPDSWRDEGRGVSSQGRRA